MMRRWGGARNAGRLRVRELAPFVMALAFVASGCTKMTGGGWIPSVVSGQKATFGFTAKCRTATIAGVPSAVLHEGQFEFHDHDFGIDVHGDVQPVEIRTVPGMTCRQVAEADPNLLKVGGFNGTYRAQHTTGPVTTGEFAVAIADGGNRGTIDGDEICVGLLGAITYTNCGVVQGGNVKVE